MTHEPTPSRPVRPQRGAARALLIALLLPAGGCNFIEDELTWLDRRAPSTAAVPDAPVSAEATRP